MNRTTRDRPEAEPAKSSGDESALRRWSRRKHEARVAARGKAAAPDPTPAVSPATIEKTPEPVLTDADMPPLESLDERSDYSPFMSPGVSDALRRAALRRLFSTPEMNILCELEGEFYDTRALTALGDIVTFDMRAAAKRELEKAKARAKEENRDDMTDAEDFDTASETPDASASEASHSAETDPEIVAAQADEKRPNDGGDT